MLPVLTPAPWHRKAHLPLAPAPRGSLPSLNHGCSLQTLSLPPGGLPASGSYHCSAHTGPLPNCLQDKAHLSSWPLGPPGPARMFHFLSVPPSNVSALHPSNTPRLSGLPVGPTPTFHVSISRSAAEAAVCERRSVLGTARPCFEFYPDMYKLCDDGGQVAWHL